MEAAAVARGLLGRSRGGGHSVLQLLPVLAVVVCWTCAATSSALPSLASSSVSVYADDIHALDLPAYLTAESGYSRHLLQAPGNSTSEPLLLARNRTDRPNPLKSLKKYRGGFNLSSRNYGASVGYTGIPGFIPALVWAALGLGLLLSLCFICCCCRHKAKHEYDHGRLGYLLPLLALLLFTAAAIVGSILLFYYQQKFNEELEGLLDAVVNKSESTEQGLREASDNLTNAANINIEGFFTLSDADKQQIARLNSQLNDSANDLNKETVDNRDKVNDAIRAVRIVLIVVAAVMLALVLLGLLFSALGIRPIVYFLIFAGWLLVIATWILCGVFILIDNGEGDACLAMKEWVANPSDNTSLDDIIPCDQTTSESALTYSRGYTVKIVDLVNEGLRTIVNINVPPGTTNWYNQSGPLVPQLCSIYGPAPNYAVTPCANDTVEGSRAGGVWAQYICQTASNGLCVTQGRLTRTLYSELSSAANITDSLTSSANFLVSAANCTFVRDVFNDVVDNRCDSLRKHTKWIWIGLVLVSAGSMLSILLWIVYIRRKRYRLKGKPAEPPMYKGQSQPYSPSTA